MRAIDNFDNFVSEIAQPGGMGLTTKGTLEMSTTWVQAASYVE